MSLIWEMMEVIEYMLKMEFNFYLEYLDGPTGTIKYTENLTLTEDTVKILQSNGTNRN